MKATNSGYSFLSSIERIDEILSSSDASYEEINTVPSRDKLSHTNGFYVNCCCVFIDIRNSSGMTAKYKRPTLARIYRAFISECVAVINGNIKCSEVNIHGDAVWGVMDTPYKSDIDSVFSTVAELSSLIDILNFRMQKMKGLDPVSVGIGMDYGRALMIKAGHKGSTINDVVWMGDVVNAAAKLGSYGSKSWNDRRVMVSSVIHQNLNEDNQSLLSYNNDRYCYNGNIANTLMNVWYEQNCLEKLL